MTGSEYLASLRVHLQNGGMPEDEINEVIMEYDSKFRHSSGLDEMIAERLGSPEDVAREILFEHGRSFGSGGFDPLGGSMDDGFDRADEGRDFDPLRGGPGSSMRGTVVDYDPSASKSRKAASNNKIAFIIALVCLLPILFQLLPFLLGMLAIFVGFALALSVLGSVGAAACIIAGVYLLSKFSALALCFLGAGMILFGLFGLIAMPMVKGIVALFKVAGKGLVKLFHKVFI